MTARSGPNEYVIHRYGSTFGDIGEQVIGE
jgi:hypothetical protein